jgi:hypothetical protein
VRNRETLTVYDWNFTMANFALSSTSVRTLKNALQDRFPSVKSSHLSEAIAAAAGFRTHAALLTYIGSTAAVPVVVLQEQPFIERLRNLGYPGIPPFSFGSAWLGGNDVPEEAKNLMARLLKLEARPEGRYPEIHALRNACATVFARTFGIGHLVPAKDDKGLVNRLSCGIDYKGCQPGWGNAINISSPDLDFPGSDHKFRFYERLPLSNGKYVEYGSALVAMPYKDSFRMDLFPAAQAFAEQVGWQSAELEDWSWYEAANATTLIFFRRTTTHEEMLRMWSTSFKRWLIENRSRLMKGANPDRRHVIEDAIAAQHLPLDVQSWDDLRERYFKEFAPSMYHFEEAPMARAFKKVFEKWLSETAMPETIAA